MRLTSKPVRLVTGCVGLRQLGLADAPDLARLPEDESEVWKMQTSLGLPH